MPVVTVAPNDALLEKLKSNMQEVRARGGVLYVLADADTHIESAKACTSSACPNTTAQLSPAARGAAAAAGLPHGLRAGDGCGQAAQPGQERDGRVIIEAKKQGATLTGVELQSSRYAQGLPTSLPAWRRPLPFVWESTGVETHFTNGLDPEPRARAVFAFFRPELLVQWLAYLPSSSSSLQRQPRARSPRHLPHPHALHAQAGHRMGQRRRALCPVARPNQRHHQPGKKPRRQQAQGPHPDGHRQRQDVYQHRLHLPPHQVWRCAPRAVSGGPGQPGPPDQERV
jgi:hypothetical protein